ncbi:MAG: bifunctional methylenetetrahydrofolate dehydrogenase/methenyltetrahydrofolate cyclohydrolase FolD [Candidatus Obscuribacterales bacterium]|nr:bifunctional methylenetetrahydrofolate dehydrogenase/methenyltetrahydrofolate cyclohydrolase FolD [Candidatus Obscuribacterales bacterium]
MSALDVSNILDGKQVANLVREELRLKVDGFVQQGKRRPGLAVVLIGENPASHVYVKNKIAACKKAGIESFFHQFAADVTLPEVLSCIKKLNSDENVDGILVQLPLPKHLPTDEVLEALSPDKDADGLHPYNLGQLFSGKDGLRPCTPKGIMVLLERYGVNLSGKNAVVVGRSNLVGKPIALMLQEKNATVTMCHSKTANLDEVCRSADVLVVAAGRENMVRGSWVKPGAVVIDVGINRIETPTGESQLVGDVEFAGAAEVASLITPVPGGVGPMTVAMLLANTVAAYEKHLK